MTMQADHRVLAPKLKCTRHLGRIPGWGRALEDAPSPIPSVFVLPILESAWAVSGLQVASGKGVVARNCRLLMNMQAGHRVFAPVLSYTQRIDLATEANHATVALRAAESEALTT